MVPVIIRQVFAVDICHVLDRKKSNGPYFGGQKIANFCLHMLLDCIGRGNSCLQSCLTIFPYVTFIRAHLMELWPEVEVAA